MTLEHSLETLADILALEKDWDGYGSDPFEKPLVDLVKSIVKELTIQPEIFPTGRRSIQIEYDAEDESYFEAEIFIDHASILEIPYHEYTKAITRTVSPEEVTTQANLFLANHKVKG